MPNSVRCPIVQQLTLAFACAIQISGCGSDPEAGPGGKGRWHDDRRRRRNAGGDGPSVAPPAPDAGSAAVPDGPAAASACPKCLADLVAPCTPAGSCVQQNVNFSLNVCYANGVKLFTPLPFGPILTPNPTSTTRVTRPDGADCYLRDSSGGNPGPISITYRTPDRKDVGFIIMGPPPGQVQIACAGETPRSGDPACLTQLGIGVNRMCTQGTCM
jgi:hypothetical protein